LQSAITYCMLLSPVSKHKLYFR